MLIPDIAGPAYSTNACFKIQINDDSSCCRPVNDLFKSQSIQPNVVVILVFFLQAGHIIVYVCYEQSEIARQAEDEISVTGFAARSSDDADEVKRHFGDAFSIQRARRD